MTPGLYLIPTPIAEQAEHTLPAYIHEHVSNIKHYYVENLRSARRFLKAVCPSIVIDDLQFEVIDKNGNTDWKPLREWLQQNKAVGVISEAGCPAIADPGAYAVQIAHELNIPVHPLVGPSSILLALMASGLNGQGFRFVGYLPIKEPLRSQQIKQLERNAQQYNETQIFIETPYRNQKLLQEILQNCEPNTQLCIAYDLTGPQQSVKTLSIKAWKKMIAQVALPKLPAIFMLGKTQSN